MFSIVIQPTPPDYAGGSLVNLVAELEQRLRGSSESPGLASPMAAVLPAASSYVLVVFDGLGTSQLDHHAASNLRDHLIGSVDAPFPTTTTVSLASIASGRPPSQHGLLGYQLWIPEVSEVVNTIKWTSLWGDPIGYDTTHLLEPPNLWERLAAAGIEPITVQPGNFATSPLSRALYRGCRFEAIYSTQEWVSAVVDLASLPGRLIFAYLPHVDFAAHVHGQASPEYDEALATADRSWADLVRRLPQNAAAIGTADHGHVDFPPERRFSIPRRDQEGRILYGDSRVMFVRGGDASLAADLPATWVPLGDMRSWWGPGPVHPAFEGRAPDGVLVADEGWVLLHRRSDKRLIGNHGGLTEAERLVPVLVNRSE
jgi:hypothetical protein